MTTSRTKSYRDHPYVFQAITTLGVFAIAVTMYAGDMLPFLSSPGDITARATAIDASQITDPVYAYEDHHLHDHHESPGDTVTHLPTPEPLKAVYMTSWYAGTKNLRKKVIDLVDNTEANSIVIDIKDATGRVAFPIEGERVAAEGSIQTRVRDMRELIAELHDRGIYVIGRVSVFQDPWYVKNHPEHAVLSLSKGTPWKDRNGLGWVDVGAKEYWDYVIEIARGSYDVGFDEIQLDYIRYPSDGNMSDISLPHSGHMTKPAALLEFYDYFDEQYQLGRPERAPTSVDFFGLTTTSRDGMGIGQILEDALPYFDYISPMVYPSHYPRNFSGYPNPAEHPYDIIRLAMTDAVLRTKVAGFSELKIRPWLQHFDMGAKYTPALIRAQIEAVYDSGLTSWLMWDPGNTYVRDAFLDATD